MSNVFDYCSICLEPFECGLSLEDPEYPVRLSCSHVFHRDCIRSLPYHTNADTDHPVHCPDCGVVPSTRKDMVLLSLNTDVNIDLNRMTIIAAQITETEPSMRELLQGIFCPGSLSAFDHDVLCSVDEIALGSEAGTKWAHTVMRDISTNMLRVSEKAATVQNEAMTFWKEYEFNAGASRWLTMSPCCDQQGASQRKAERDVFARIDQVDAVVKDYKEILRTSRLIHIFMISKLDPSSAVRVQAISQHNDMNFWSRIVSAYINHSMKCLLHVLNQV